MVLVACHLSLQARAQATGQELAEAEDRMSKRSAELESMRKAQAVSLVLRFTATRIGGVLLTCVWAFGLN